MDETQRTENDAADGQEYDIHPLDRDYSEPVAARPKQPLAPHLRLRRVGMITFAAGFISLLPSAIVVSLFPSSWLETLGSQAHRLGMLAILIGGLIIVVSYRMPEKRRRSRRARPTRRRGEVPFSMLVICSVVIFVAVALVLALSQTNRSFPVALLLAGLLGIGSAFAVTLLVWHRGYVRAYAIGILVTSALSGLPAMLFWGGPSGRNGSTIFLAQVATVLAGGLVCGGYVFWLEQYRDEDSLSERMSDLDQVPESTGVRRTTDS